MKQAYIAAFVAAAVLLLGAAAETLAQAALEPSAPGARTQPSIILGPPREKGAPESLAEPAAEEPTRDLPPIARKKPQPPERVSTPKRPRQAAPAKKARQKKVPAKRKAPARAARTPPQQQAKNCDYCYGCEASIHACRRQWVCGKRYTDRLAAGLCRR